eukprot:967460_1
MSAKGSKQLKVLYIHGLESGPHGRKARILKQDFDVYAADMKMSTFNIKRKNSFLCSALRQHLLPLILVIIILVFAITSNAFYQYILYGIALLYFVVMIIFCRKLKGWIVMSSFNKCLTVQKQAILEYKPDVIVASSWGGAIGFELIKQNIWSGPTILICPAYLRIRCMNHAKNMLEPDYFVQDTLRVKTECDSKYSKKKWLIFHSEDDNVVNIKDSQWIVKCNQKKFELHTVKDNGHAMKPFVVSKQLNEAVKQYCDILLYQDK